jgi:hypothetical protein
MQSWSWYARRLRHMSADELAWRARAAARDAADRVRIRLALHDWDGDPPPGRYPQQLTSLPLSLLSGPPGPATHHDRALQAAADDLIAHRLTFLNLERVDLGAEIDWNRDYEAGTRAPRGYANAIDYRDARIAGDAKVVWEPSRHLHLAVLGRAYRATGHIAYAREGLSQIESWIAQCPFGTGMQWRSPLELAIRAINWTWFLALIAPSGLLTGARLARVLHVLDAHVHDITRKYSRGSSANNHRIGEAAGVFVACACLPHLAHARDRVAVSGQILDEEILAQNFADGGNREQAFGYHLFVLQFLLIAAYTARCTGHPLSRRYLERLDAMVDFVDALTAAGPAPMYGDADDGYVLDLGDRGRGGRELLGVGDCLLGRAPREASEPVMWLFPDVAASNTPPRALSSRAFPETGLYLLQSGDATRGDSISLTFDCGTLGFEPLAAHGHADALNFTLRAFGEDIFVDPGTYDYFRYPRWRDYFRSTRAHNTIAIDGVDQSVMLGPFMWGARATARCIEWTQNAAGSRVIGEHDGYLRLADPVLHRRAIDMQIATRTFTIRDSLTMAAEHRIALYFHVSERATVRRVDRHGFEIATPRGSVELRLDPRTEPSVIEAGEEPRGGWVSRGYHHRAPSTSIVASLASSRDVEIESRLVVGMPR